MTENTYASQEMKFWSILYPQVIPIRMQYETLVAGVMAGATQFAARAPLHLAITAPVDDVAVAHRMADEIDDMFARCPVRQWFCAAQASQGWK